MLLDRIFHSFLKVLSIDVTNDVGVLIKNKFIACVRINYLML